MFERCEQSKTCGHCFEPREVRNGKIRILCFHGGKGCQYLGKNSAPTKEILKPAAPPEVPKPPLQAVRCPNCNRLNVPNPHKSIEGIFVCPKCWTFFDKDLKIRNELKRDTTCMR